MGQGGHRACGRSNDYEGWGTPLSFVPGWKPPGHNHHDILQCNGQQGAYFSHQCISQLCGALKTNPIISWLQEYLGRKWST